MSKVVKPVREILRKEDVWFKVVQCGSTEVGEGECNLVFILTIILVTTEEKRTLEEEAVKLLGVRTIKGVRLLCLCLSTLRLRAGLQGITKKSECVLEGHLIITRQIDIVWIGNPITTIGIRMVWITQRGRGQFNRRDGRQGIRNGHACSSACSHR